jgi:hypothetical protein
MRWRAGPAGAVGRWWAGALPGWSPCAGVGVAELEVGVFGVVQVVLADAVLVDQVAGQRRSRLLLQVGQAAHGVGWSGVRAGGIGGDLQRAGGAQQPPSLASAWWTWGIDTDLEGAASATGQLQPQHRPLRRAHGRRSGPGTLR